MLGQLRRMAHLRTAVTQARTFVKVGDTIPVNFQKEGQDPVIKEEKEYPDWLKHMDLPTRVELENKMNKVGLDSMEIPELRRYLKLNNRTEIKAANSDLTV